jgi:hypothetical protein
MYINFHSRGDLRMVKPKNIPQSEHTIQSAYIPDDGSGPSSQQPSAPGPNDTVINLVDLQNILVVFDLASNRGAFKGGELEAIGQLYNKVSKFVQAATPKPPEGTSPTGGP